jgi:hypothetical protein
MQFSVSSLVALALSLSLASAAPATSNPKRDCNTVDVQFEGADITQFTIPVCADGNAIAVGKSPAFLDLSGFSFHPFQFPAF